MRFSHSYYYYNNDNHDLTIKFNFFFHAIVQPRMEMQVRLPAMKFKT